MIQATGYDSYGQPLSEICPALWRDTYTRHNAAIKVTRTDSSSDQPPPLLRVQGLVPPSQLLVYRVGEGWERLCEFLGHEVARDDTIN